MPPAGAAIGAVVVVASTTATGVAAGVAFTTALVTGLIMGAASMVLSIAAQALAPKPKTPSTGGRNMQVRQPITVWAMAEGYVRTSGPLVFIEGTQNNQRMHMVIIMSCDEVASFEGLILNDYPIYPDMLTETGLVSSPNCKYNGLVIARFHTGSPDQLADELLVSQTTAKETDRAQGRAYLYIRYLYDQNLFPGSVPNASVITRGKKHYDPRTGTIRWRPNPALWINGYLTRPRNLGGLGVSATEVNTGELIASANICEEIVDTAPVTITITNVNSVVPGLLECDDKFIPLLYGDRFHFNSAANLPTSAQLLVDYYAVPCHPQRVLQGNSNLIMRAGVQVASTLDNALEKTIIPFGVIASGANFTITKDGEMRYSGGGMMAMSSEPGQTLDDLRSAMAGRIWYIGGEWIIKAGAYTTPTFNINEDDLRRGPAIQTRVSIRERYNAVKGTHYSPFEGWQPADYPPVTNSTYQDRDGGGRNYHDLPLPYTLSKSACQRIAKIELERGRREMSLKMPCKLTVFDVQGGDAGYVSLSRFGISNKEFEAAEVAVVLDQDEDDIPLYGVDLNLREYDIGIFSWTTLEEATLPTNPVSTLPDPFNPLEPGGPTVTETLYDTRGSAGVKSKAVVTWLESEDAFVDLYFLEYKLAGSSDFTVLSPVSTTSIEIFDMAPGLYDFRVRGQNTLGVFSEYSETTTWNIYGLLAPPTAPQNMTILGMGGLAVIRWDLSPDLDVLTGGVYEFRHSSALVNPLWEESVTIGNHVPGSETVGIFPLKPGSYLAKAIDSSGIHSTTATYVSTDGATVLPYTTLNTIIETPDLLGVHSNTANVDGNLQISGLGMVDDIPSIDALVSLDAFGGIAAAGNYTFFTVMDFGSITRVRVRTSLEVLIINTLDLIDSRLGDIDDWEDFDGTGAGSADCQIWAAATNDDPSGSPVYGEFNRVDSAEFECRALKFAARLTTSDPAYNIRVSLLRVDAEELV